MRTKMKIVIELANDVSTQEKHYFQKKLSLLLRRKYGWIVSSTQMEYEQEEIGLQTLKKSEAKH